MSSRSYLLSQEKSLVPIGSCAILIATLSGFITYLYPTEVIWQQWTYLLHLLSGLLLTFVLAIYIFYHFRKSLGTRRPGISIFGILTALTFFVLAATGIHISIFGQLEYLHWVIDTHIKVSILFVILLSMHIIMHIIVFKRENKKNTPLFPSFNKKIFIRYSLTSILSCCLLIVGLNFIYKQFSMDYSTAPVVEPYQLTYGDNPFAPSETKTDSGHFVDERLIGNSDNCGTCHQQITKQWEHSMHAQAASDPSYQRNIKLLAKTKGVAATRYCEGCHAPVPLLSGVLSKGGN